MNITVICLGKLKEKYLTDAINEYSKRISAYGKLDIIELNPVKLSENPSETEIRTALEKEAIEIIKKDLEDCAKSYYDDGEVNSVKELIDLYDWSNLDLKEEIYEILKLAASTTNFPYCFNDD